jgi:hypothetical protein
MFASVSSGRPPFTGGCDEDIEDFFAASEIATVSLEIAGDDALKSASTELGRTVMIGVPWLTTE